ncbi:MAG TPA: efflux RND transporter periplasmic adaptor subunit [Burkholderiaceae bacterium]|nr:efflux RND transporter periplasmic adaptor subunit [Burkholderiaceae bacterium]
MTTATDTSAARSRSDIDQLLGTPAQAWWRRPTLWVALVLAAVVFGGFGWWWTQRSSQAAPVYVTAPVTRGDLRLSVVANGTLQPTRTINIGSELSGTVAQVFVDINDTVKKGQVLVQLDLAKLRDQIARSRATLAAAEAKVNQAVATRVEADGNLKRLEAVFQLSAGKVPSQSELDTARATLDRARADEASARANVNDARAALSTDETNLSKASIRSPSDGVVLTRSVDPGNAVAASLQAVTLFSIAEDLRQLRLMVNVDEADVGSVVVGQHATFTVAAYPNRRFPATVTRVAYGSTTTDNVVTYQAQLDVDNQDLALRPGMTATATITATERHQVMLVPNTALRFTPAVTANSATPAAAASGARSGIVGSLIPRPPAGAGRRPGGAGAPAAPSATGPRQVYVLRDGQPVPIAVVAGISDGRMTEVGSDQLQPGMAVITDQRSGSAK